jgi:hypothetical protein
VKVTLAVTTALLGVLITILEGILQLNQYVAKPHEPVVLLAERVEAIALEENAKWASVLQQQKEAKSGT